MSDIDRPMTPPLPGNEPVSINQDEIITAMVKGETVMLTVVDALSLINQVSGVLLAHGYGRSG
jgi:hypothetical protein